MSKRKFLIAANWKMYVPPQNLEAYKPNANVDIVVFPTFLHLHDCLKNGLTVGAQCGHPEDQGAHTGNVSMKMLRELGVTHVLCGHSERRKDHGESNDFVAAQVLSALKNGLHPILCVGETREERKQGKAKEVIRAQLEAVLNLKIACPAAVGRENCKLEIAYEPVWAISGGDASKPAASAADAEEMHAFIRNLLTPHAELAEARILYGGSMKPENAEELLKQPTIDGGLVGGASLDPEKFRRIVEIAKRLSR